MFTYKYSLGTVLHFGSLEATVIDLIEGFTYVLIYGSAKQIELYFKQDHKGIPRETYNLNYKIKKSISGNLILKLSAEELQNVTPDTLSTRSPNVLYNDLSSTTFDDYQVGDLITVRHDQKARSYICASEDWFSNLGKYYEAPGLLLAKSNPKDYKDPSYLAIFHLPDLPAACTLATSYGVWQTIIPPRKYLSPKYQNWKTATVKCNSIIRKTGHLTSSELWLRLPPTCRACQLGHK